MKPRSDRYTIGPDTFTIDSIHLTVLLRHIDKIGPVQSRAWDTNWQFDIFMKDKTKMYTAMYHTPLEAAAMRAILVGRLKKG